MGKRERVRLGVFLSSDRESHFPNLRRGEYRVTSEETPRYNCIAHAAGKEDAWWWPEEFDVAYWPLVDRQETLQCFLSAFTLQGYAACEAADLEEGFEKIALYADASGVPTHAARQLATGRWTSKLGEWEDIEHDRLEALEDLHDTGLGYGRVACIMKRRILT